MITAAELKKMAIGKPNADNMASILKALDAYGATVELNRPHRLAHFLAQVMHESADFRYDQEIWGPTPAQKRYDTRADLGNTPAKDGDGEKYKGRGPIQLTGKDNVRRFTDVGQEARPGRPRLRQEPGAAQHRPVGRPERPLVLGRGQPRPQEPEPLRRPEQHRDGHEAGQRRPERLRRPPEPLRPLRARPARLRHEQGRDRRASSASTRRPAPRTAPSGRRPAWPCTRRWPASTRTRRPSKSRSPVPVPDPVVPDAVDEQVKKKTNILQWLLGLFGSGGAASDPRSLGADWMTVLAVFGGAAGLMLLVLLLRRQLIGAIGDIRDAIRGDA
jgi:putative chitinase